MEKENYILFLAQNTEVIDHMSDWEITQVNYMIHEVHYEKAMEALEMMKEMGKSQDLINEISNLLPLVLCTDDIDICEKYIKLLQEL